MQKTNTNVLCGKFILPVVLWNWRQDNWQDTFDWIIIYRTLALHLTQSMTHEQSLLPVSTQEQLPLHLTRHVTMEHTPLTVNDRWVWARALGRLWKPASSADSMEFFFQIWDSEQAILCTWMIRSGFISSFVACGNGREKGFCPALESADSLRWVISYTCSANRCPCVCLHTCTSSAHGLYLLLLAIFFSLILIYCFSMASADNFSNKQP